MQPLTGVGDGVERGFDYYQNSLLKNLTISRAYDTIRLGGS